MSQASPTRSWWSTGLATFCAATVLFLIGRDLWIPEVRDVEVWFGFEVRGSAAMWSAPLHWMIFAIGAWAFWRERPWILPAATVYAFYIAASHLVWNLTSPNGAGWTAGLWQMALFSLPALLFIQLHRTRA